MRAFNNTTKILILFFCAAVFFGSCEETDPNPCDTVTCVNGGTCNDGNCDCPDGFSGTNCEKQDLCFNVTCENEGTCINGLCDCPDGFSGDNCEIEEACYAANANNEWSYDEFGGPDCWSSVCSHGDCLGDQQSPINIANAVSNITLPSLSISPGTTTTTIENNGHTLEFKQDPGSFISYGQLANGLIDDYTLGQFHFHANSEHQVDGSYAPLEAHFVCRSIWANNYIVISVLFEEGESNAFLEKFVDDLPDTAHEEFEMESLTYSAFDLLPSNKSYYSYSGSLTTPPCSEVVNWIVMKNKVTATAEQIATFSTILGNNFRPVQALNGRTIHSVDN